MHYALAKHKTPVGKENILPSGTKNTVQNNSRLNWNPHQRPSVFQPYFWGLDDSLKPQGLVVWIINRACSELWDPGFKPGVMVANAMVNKHVDWMRHVAYFYQKTFWLHETAADK